MTSPPSYYEAMKGDLAAYHQDRLSLDDLLHRLHLTIREMERNDDPRATEIFDRWWFIENRVAVQRDRGESPTDEQHQAGLVKVIQRFEDLVNQELGTEQSV